MPGNQAVSMLETHTIPKGIKKEWAYLTVTCYYLGLISIICICEKA